MAIAHQPAMPRPAATTRPAGTSRHVLVPAVEVRPGLVVARLAGLMFATSVAIGTVVALTLALATGTLTQLGH
jgi:hypothetical protein